MKSEKALVIFSGGQDSTTCLYWAKREFKDVVAVSFNYNQRHSLELECAKAICKEADVEHHILDLSLLNQLAPSSLTRDEMDVQKTVEDGSVPNSCVDGRNLLFLTFSSVFAKQRGIKHIVTGVSQSDFSGYPDCRDVFIKSANVTLNLSMDYNFVIHTPLMWIDKKETWALADELNILNLVREKTLTCYNGVIGDGCKECPACDLRNKGLQEYLKTLD